MIWNVFDWTVGPFLMFYVTMAAIVFLAGFGLRMRIGPPASAIRKLSALELAYLGGGASRVGDAALLSLMLANAATIGSRTIIGSTEYTITVTDETLPSTVLGWPMRSHKGSNGPWQHNPLVGLAMTRREFQTEVTPLVGRVQSRLQELGYCPTDEQMRSLRMTVVPFILLLLGVGVIKAVVDAERHQPNGILVFLLMLTVIPSIALACRPTRTRAGTDALENYQASHARASRAPRDNELVLAVALSGAEVLSGTPYESVYAASKKESDSDGGCACA